MFQILVQDRMEGREEENLESCQGLSTPLKVIIKREG